MWTDQLTSRHIRSDAVHIGISSIAITKPTGNVRAECKLKSKWQQTKLRKQHTEGLKRIINRKRNIIGTLWWSWCSSLSGSQWKVHWLLTEVESQTKQRKGKPYGRDSTDCQIALLHVLVIRISFKCVSPRLHINKFPCPSLCFGWLSIDFLTENCINSITMSRWYYVFQFIIRLSPSVCCFLNFVPCHFDFNLNSALKFPASFVIAIELIPMWTASDLMCLDVNWSVHIIFLFPRWGDVQRC